MTPITVAVLAFEARRWNYQGAKEQAAHDLFGLSAHRYFLTRNAVIDRPEALVFDPPLVNRLRRLRDAQRAARRLQPVS